MHARPPAGTAIALALFLATAAACGGKPEAPAPHESLVRGPTQDARRPQEDPHAARERAASRATPASR